MDPVRPDESPTLLDRAKGCLLGGAIGDSLGAPVEFLTLAAIKAKFGPDGIQELAPAYGLLGAITDDTQMSLFSAEGLIRAKVRGALKGICHPPDVVAYSYQRWLHTQGEPCHEFAIQEEYRGWLLGVKELYARRAPGNTCLSALRVWNQEPATNDSKGCGTVMRSAPFGFVEWAWQLAWECAAITHGHIEAKASAAILAEAVRLLTLEYGLEDAIQRACGLDRDGTESTRLVLRAITLAKAEITPERAIRELGEGWVAEEALAIAVYCAVKAEKDFELALLLAVNHDGDSDSTGAIAGNLMGAAYGVQIIPNRWLQTIELRDVIEQLASDMVAKIPVAPWYDATEEQLSEERDFWARYPGC